MRSYAKESGCAKTTISIVAAIVFALPSYAQDTPGSLSSQVNSAKHEPITITLKDALGLAERNDPSVLAASSDATSAREDRRQASVALYPSLSARSEYLGTEGNGKLPEVDSSRTTVFTFTENGPSFIKIFRLVR